MVGAVIRRRRGARARLSRTRSVRLESSANPGALVRAAPLRAFYAALLTRAAARGTLRVATLHLDDAPAAMLWALQVYNRLWLLKMAYHDRVARISPGVLLMRFVLRTAHDLRLDAVEFLADDAPWQQRWQPVARCYTSALAVPLTARGLIGLGLNAVFSAPAAPAGSRHASGAHDRLRHAARHELRLPAALRGRPDECVRGCTSGGASSSASRRPWRAARQRFTIALLPLRRRRRRLGRVVARCPLPV